MAGPAEDEALPVVAEAGPPGAEMLLLREAGFEADMVVVTTGSDGAIVQYVTSKALHVGHSEIIAGRARVSRIDVDARPRSA